MHLQGEKSAFPGAKRKRKTVGTAQGGPGVCRENHPTLCLSLGPKWILCVRTGDPWSVTVHSWVGVFGQILSADRQVGGVDSGLWIDFAKTPSRGCSFDCFCQQNSNKNSNKTLNCEGKKYKREFYLSQTEDYNPGSRSSERSRRPSDAPFPDQRSYIRMAECYCPGASPGTRVHMQREQGRVTATPTRSWERTQCL